MAVFTLGARDSRALAQNSAGTPSTQVPFTYIYLPVPLDLCGNSFARYSEKCSTQIYRALYGDTLLVPMQMSTNMAAVK